MTTVLTSRPEVDLLDPMFHVGDPHPSYAWMRRNEPVYHDTRNNLWCVTRMEHLRQVERHAATFSSAQGYRSVHVPSETSMISKDDPAHTTQRKLIADRFTPRSVGRLEDAVRDIVQRAMSTFGFVNQVEVIDALAARIPAVVTCRMLGWEDHHWREVSSWSERFMRIDTMGVNPQQLSDGIRAVAELAALVDESIPQRRECPADDILTVWSQAELNGCPMSIEEINSELGLVIPGGAETTRTTLSRALVLFCERNDLWEQIAAEPESIPLAVEELLRYITPLNNMFRTVTEPTDIDGTKLDTGARIALVYPSANRDEAVFEQPDEIDLRRDPNPHIAFGFGTHFCLGAHVARLVLRVTLEELAGRLTNLRAVEPAAYEPNVFVKAVSRFVLGFDRR
ncbi:MAG: cholest-4-en-3-one 26-monooxygenase [Actinomycetota bacterium]|jgi:cytochrome P450 family 142 subfamily A polypeptide 1